MATAKLKTAPTKRSVREFLNGVADKEQRQDAEKLAKLFRQVTGKRATMWGPSIVGFGKYRYKYASGRQGEFLRAGFSPRKGTLVVYIITGYTDHSALLSKLGRHKMGKSCLYIKRLADVDLSTLQQLVRAGWSDMEIRYGKA